MPALATFASAVLTGVWLVLSPGVAAVPRLVLAVMAITGFVLALKHGTTSLMVCGCLGVALLAAAVTLAPRNSHDVWSYAMYGRMIVTYHESPYTHTPQEHPGDVIEQRVAPGWRHVASVYGPAFSALSAGLSSLAGTSALLNRLGFQLFDALCVLIVALVAAKRSGDGRLITALALNPAIIAIVNGGHNDIVAGTLVLAGLAVTRHMTRHIKSAGFILGLAVLVKAVAIVPLLALVAWAIRQDRARAVRLSLPAAATITSGYIALGGTSALQALTHTASTTSRASIWALPHHLLVTSLGSVAAHTVTLCLAAAVGLVATYAAWTRARDHDPALFITAVVVISIFVSPYVLPWYCAIPLILALAVWQTTMFVVVQVQALALVIAYVVPPGVEAIGLTGSLSSAIFTVAALSVPVIAPVIASYGARLHE